MAKIEVSVEIKQPVKKVFALVTDLNSRSLWEPAMLEIEITSGEGWAAGAKLRGITLVMDQKIAWTADVLEFKPDKIMLLKVSSKMASFEEHFTVDPVEGGTRLTIVYAIELHGMAKLAAPMVTGVLEKQLKENLARLKSLLEA